MTVEELPPVLTVEETAKFLRISRGSAYAAAAAGELPGAFRIGRTIRISRAALLAALGEMNGHEPEAGDE